MPSDTMSSASIMAIAARTVGPENPELYAECQQREKAGYLDAVCLGPDNDFCGDCEEERLRSARLANEWDLWSL